MPSSDAAQITPRPADQVGSYAVGGIVRVLCSIRLLVLVLAVAEALLRQDGGVLALVALAAAPFSFVPALNWSTRGPVYFRNGVLLSGDIVVTVLVLVDLAGAPLMAAYGAATVALWGATTGMRVASLMAVPVAALVVPWSVFDGGWRSLAGGVVSVAAVFGMAWVGKSLGDGVRRHQQTATDLAHERAEHAAAEERLRIARDLHDTVAGDLAGMRLIAGGLRSRIEAGDHRAATADLARVLEEAVAAAHRHTRVTLDELRTEPGLRTELEAAARRRVASADVELRTMLRGPLDAVSLRLAGDARAVVGELLENVRKHARASAAVLEVEVTADGSELVVVVDDDGQGMAPAPTPDGHYGLRGIRERAEACGGSATWSRSELGGTRARVTLRDAGVRAPAAEPAPAAADMTDERVA